MHIGLCQLTASRRGDLYASPILLRELPREWFSPSEDLHRLGWPDFSIRSLADWSSSARPAPEEPDDCCLVLAFTRVIPLIDPSDGWTLVSHETGGMWLEQQRVAAKKLSVGPKGLQIIHAIGRAMAGTNCAAAFASFDQLSSYRQVLNEYGLDCNHHMQAMAEGFYPIDPDEEALGVLQVIDLEPEALEVVGTGRACLAVLAPNCSDW